MILSPTLMILALLMALIVIFVILYRVISFIHGISTSKEKIKSLIQDTMYLTMGVNISHEIWEIKYRQLTWLEKKLFWKQFYKFYFGQAIQIKTKKILELFLSHGLNMNKKQSWFSKNPLFALYFNPDNNTGTSSRDLMNDTIFSTFREDLAQLALIERYMKSQDYPDNHPYYSHMLALRIDQEKKQIAAVIKKSLSLSNSLPSHTEPPKRKTHKI